MSWLLLGSVNHALKFGNTEVVICQPIPLEASCHIADHIQVILAGFAEQSKTSVVHMCSLFHAFILCQLWTVYLEQTIALLPATAGWAGSNAGVLVKWLQRLQFKMGQIEMQASNVTQFFTV